MYLPTVCRLRTVWTVRATNFCTQRSTYIRTKLLRDGDSLECTGSWVSRLLFVVRSLAVRRCSAAKARERENARLSLAIPQKQIYLEFPGHYCTRTRRGTQYSIEKFTSIVPVSLNSPEITENHRLNQCKTSSLTKLAFTGIHPSMFRILFLSFPPPKSSRNEKCSWIVWSPFATRMEFFFNFLSRSMDATICAIRNKIGNHLRFYQTTSLRRVLFVTMPGKESYRCRIKRTSIFWKQNCLPRAVKCAIILD